MTGFDPALTAIVGLSLHVSLSAVFFGLLIGSPLAIWDFRGKQVLVVSSNAMIALPPVVGRPQLSQSDVPEHTAYASLGRRKC